MSEEGTNMVDCGEGRHMGCQTYCCRLVVRITEEERKRIYPTNQEKTCLDKDLSDGLCEFLDRDTMLCSIFDIRPSICRSFTCDDDKLLQTAMRHEMKDIVDLVVTAGKTFIPLETWKNVPRLKE